MEPKKKSNTFCYVLILVTLLLVVYISFQGAAAWLAVSDRGVAGFDSFTEFTFELEHRIFSAPLNIYLTDYTFNWLTILGLMWFIIAVYFLTTRRKLIIGKEHGTAIWGSEKDISDLFACNLEKSEIRKVKREMFFKLLRSLLPMKVKG
ncbi:MAG: hypothetical protein FWC20_04395 [Oscillospiraceae bacterium]|nr:hypothetical protein [Oscillospiraceae bacterium]MCL2278632.1 hypothetical protein [Oscillospiraceae bacterium]